MDDENGRKSASTLGGAPSLAEARENVGASVYTFHCWSEDGSPVCLEAQELSSDQRALDWAPSLLDEHQTCARIEVFLDERPVGVVVRKSDEA